MSKLLIEKRGAVTLLTLNRPEVHNNVDDELACLLADAIIDFGQDDDQSVLVIFLNSLVMILNLVKNYLNFGKRKSNYR